MSLKINTNIQNDVDGYLIDASAVKGGYVVVSGVGTDIKENIPVASLVEGSWVYDAKLKKAYRWDGSAWQEDALYVTTDKSNTFTETQKVESATYGGVILNPADASNSASIVLTDTENDLITAFTPVQISFKDSSGNIQSLAYADIATKDDAKQFQTVDAVPEGLLIDKYLFVKIAD